MPWFYNSYSGKLVHEDPPSPGYYLYESALHTGTGWHELAVADSADTAQAMAAATKFKQQHGGAAPSTTKSAGQYLGTAAGQGVQKAAGGIWGSFPWLRIAEVVLGLVLLAVGIAKMTDAVPIATKVAKAVS